LSKVKVTTNRPTGAKLIDHSYYFIFSKSFEF
jgi:hypothetical protein